MKTIALLLIASGTITAQPARQTCAVVSREAAKMEFDAVSVKPAITRGGATGIRGGPGSNDPERITTPRIAPAFLIFIAYDLWSDQLQGPAWMSSETDHLFGISATMPATATKEQYCGMLRNLLAERFHLTFHHESQPRPGYDLTVLPGGPKFKQYEPGQSGTSAGPTAGTDANGFRVMLPGQPAYAAQLITQSGLRKLNYRNNMGMFARFMGAQISQNRGGPSNEPLPRVVDKTGLAGSWDIRLEYQILDLPGAHCLGCQNVPPPDGAAQAPDPVEGPNLFNAVQQQLGLKLQKVKDVPIDVLVVDHIDQMSTEN
jgi:uncharacterized protein (TIGR03435 family)